MELPDAHAASVFCLGRAHVEAAHNGSDCPFCEQIPVKALRARISLALNYTSNPMAPPSLCRERAAWGQTGAVGPSHGSMSTSVPHAHNLKLPPLSPLPRGGCAGYDVVWGCRWRGQRQ